MAIGGSVGQDGVNAEADVVVVQSLLNTWLESIGRARIPVDGDCGPTTITTIKAFQAKVLEAASPDGRIDPGGRSWAALTSVTAKPKPRPRSGADWWHANQGKFPNSNAIADLAAPFRDKVADFLDALDTAGATVAVSSTRRNRTRAALMHYSWRVANGSLAPRDVPAIAGSAIEWDHGDSARSRQAAQAMVDLFGLAFQPSLTSLHIEGRAIDMTIGWTGTLRIKDKVGATHAIGAPRNGASNTKLHAVGASYGVHKLLSDPPHWSDNGR